MSDDGFKFGLLKESLSDVHEKCMLGGQGANGSITAVGDKQYVSAAGGKMACLLSPCARPPIQA